MTKKNLSTHESLSPWWRRGVFIILLIEFAVLIWITTGTYTRHVGPPVPQTVENESGSVLFTGDDIKAGQELFLKKALMNHGTVWGHGAYMGPDFSAEYLHNLAVETRRHLSDQQYGKSYGQLSVAEQEALQKVSYDFLSKNRYDVERDRLLFTPPEEKSYSDQQAYWHDYFSKPEGNRGLAVDLIKGPEELRQLTAFFSWAAWATTAHIPDKDFSYTNNFPYEPLIGNGPSTAAIMWSALSLIALLAGTALILFAFGRFHYLGWKGSKDMYPPQLLPGSPTSSQISS
ncbi:MAG TPA: hypothetical protein VE870_16535, partial [Bacteroidales bacterium]|nr:hypothetical protein [Bacteroidales bacterium]